MAENEIVREDFFLLFFHCRNQYLYQQWVWVGCLPSSTHSRDQAPLLVLLPWGWELRYRCGERLNSILWPTEETRSAPRLPPVTSACWKESRGCRREQQSGEEVGREGDLHVIAACFHSDGTVTNCAVTFPCTVLTTHQQGANSKVLHDKRPGITA